MAQDNFRFLGKYNFPDYLKKMNNSELSVLAGEVRETMIKVVSENGGHLSSNLGVVELSIALHRVFNSPRDKFVWDVGHQIYAHKILTDVLNSLKRFAPRAVYRDFRLPTRATTISFTADIQVLRFPRRSG